MPCKQYQTTKLDCCHRNMKYIPTISADITSLFLCHNLMSTLHSAPFTHTSGLVTLDLSFNKLTDIPSNCFHHLNSLEFLDIHSNEVSDLSSTSFNGLQNLQYLDISNNQLTLLPDGVFSHLSNLKSLNLSGNILVSLPTENFIPLRSLPVNSLHVTFDILSPFILTEGMKDLKGLSNLSYLTFAVHTIPKDITEVADVLDHLMDLQIRRIDISWGDIIHAIIRKHDESLILERSTTSQPECCQAHDKLKLLNSTIQLQFNGWKQFTTLGTLSTNSLRPLSKFHQVISLSLHDAEILDIDEDGTPFTWFPFLQHLDLSKNSLDYLPDSAFNGLDILEELSLAHNNLDIPFIEGALYDLPCLKSINMSSNYFLFIPPAAFSSLSFCNSLRILDLSNNDLTFDFPDDAFTAISSLTTLHLHSNEAIQIAGWINELANLSDLYLQNNEYIDIYTSEWTTPLLSLTNLDLSECQNLRWFDGPANISDMVPNLHRGLFHKTKLDLLIIQDLQHLHELDLKACQISTNDLETSWFHIQASKLKILDLGANNITSIPHNFFTSTPLLTHLNLSCNQLKIMQNDTFLSLQNLQILDLQGNRLTTVYSLHFAPSLQGLNIAWNQISQFPEKFVTQISHLSGLHSINFAGNPFECTCDITALLTWIELDTTVRLEYSDSFTCAQPNKTKNSSIFDVDLTCTSHLPFYLSISLCACLVVILIGGLIAKYRWHLNYKCFLLLHRRPSIVLDDLAANNLHKSPAQVTYDAYVSYSDNDEDWVLNELRINLEENTPEPAKLCLGRVRDFIPGTAIVEAISDAVQNSRKTILILTPSFVESEWCYYETQMAQMRLFHEGHDVLILVMLKTIPDDMLTMSLRQLLCKKDYFRWPHDKAGQKLFWQRLRYELRTPIKVDRRYDK